MRTTVNHKSIFKFFATAIAASLIASVASAATVFIQDVQMEGTDTSLKATVRELVRAAVNNETGYQSVGKPEGAELTLQPRLLKLGDSYFLTIDKMKGSEILYTANMKATTASDLDVVSTRVVRSALRGAKTSETALVTDVTQDETTRGTRRFEATRQWKFGLGPGWGLDTNTSAGGTHWMLGYVWGIEPQWDVDLTYRHTSISKSGESGASFGDFSLGAAYTFNLEKNAPYVTFGFGKAWADISTTEKGLFGDSNDTAAGWSGHVGAGYKFFRTSNVNLAVEGTYIHLLDKSSVSGKSPGVFNVAAVIFY